jgi:hypothetical protein
MSQGPIPIKRDFDDVEHIIGPAIRKIGLEARQKNLLSRIRLACENDKAFIFMLPEGDSFTVLRPMSDDIVQIWVAYSQDGNATEQYLPTIKELCREIGATTIEFETTLEAMERYMPRFGWKKQYTVWRQAIDE